MEGHSVSPRVVESKIKGHIFKVGGGRFKRDPRAIFFLEVGVYMEQNARGRSRDRYI